MIDNTRLLRNTICCLSAAAAAAAWGDEHDAYKKLAETVGQADTPLIIAGVPISNSETYPVNPKLAVRILCRWQASIAHHNTAGTATVSEPLEALQAAASRLCRPQMRPNAA